MSKLNPNEPLDPSLIERLVHVDERLAEDTAAGESAAAEQTPALKDVADCLRLLQRVRETSPELMADLQAEPDAGRMWLGGHGSLPDRLGRFHIVRVLGQGGFGIVFLGFDPDLERHVAIKVPRIEALIDSASRARFLREAKALARLNHANIAAIYESGAIGPLTYIASAYCAGGSLADACGRLPDQLSYQGAARLTLAIANAVQHAHSRGILHRDIKPSNILIDALPEELPALFRAPEQLASKLRLVDFGLSVNPDASEDRTRSGVVLGTPTYMAPEQAAGTIGSVGPGTDVYALGAVLYWLLSGQPPIKRETDFETLLAVRNDLPPSLRKLDARIPRDLEAVCYRCLEKDPNRRYASATELSDDLERFLQDQPVHARHITSWERAWRWCRMNPAVASLATILFLCLAGISASSLVVAHHFREQRDELAASLKRAESAEQSASELAESLRMKMDALNGEDVISGWTQIIENGEATARAYVTRGEAYLRKGDFQAALGDFEQAMEREPEFPWGKLYASWTLSLGPEELRDPQRAVRLAEEGASYFSHRHWSVLHVQGYAYYRVGRYEDARDHLAEAITQRGDGGNSLMLFFLAMSHHRVGDKGKSRELFELAVDRLDQASDAPYHLFVSARDEAKDLLNIE